jgi:hypothetical protein
MNKKQELFKITWRQTYTDWQVNELADPIELALMDSDFSEARELIEKVKNLNE